MDYRRELAALIHDLNNLLMVLIASLGEINTRCEAHDEATEVAERILERIAATKIKEKTPTIIAVPIRQIIEMTEQQLQKIPFSYDIHQQLGPQDLDKLVYYSPGGLEPLRDNLVSNWQKAGVTHLHLIFSLDTMNSSLSIEVVDNGCGMSTFELEKIRTGPMIGEGKKGKGCQIIRGACARSGRTISWESIQFIGTKITLRHRLVLNGNSNLTEQKKT
jgi:signal transduction histidine kinase